MKFQCPKCKHKGLEVCETNAFVSTPIIDLGEDGDFVYDEPVIQDSVVDRFQCFNCGYILKNEQGENIIDNFEVVNWLRKNCSQK